MEQVKLLSMTAVLTLLIWASADSLVNEAVSVRVFFDVVPASGPDMLVEMDEDSVPFQMSISGPRRMVEAIQAREPLRIRLPIANQSTGRATIDLDGKLIKQRAAEQWREFAKLSVVSIHPATLDVVVDHVISEQVEIVLKRLTLAFEDAPQLDRTVTTVRMREAKFRELTQSGRRLQIEVGPDAERLLRARPPGRTATVAVLLDSTPFGANATLDPDVVSVTATLQADRRTVEVPTVPIKPVVSFANLGKTYHAVGRDGTPLTLETRTIKVSGPSEDIARLLRGETRAYGFVQLKEADLDELGVLKPWRPQFLLPANIKLVSEPDPVEFMLIATLAKTPGIE